MTPRCLCCDHPLSPVACFDGWCAECAGKALAELLSLRDIRERATVADILRMCGALTMASIIVRVPFEARVE